jgi:hypothetical protein
MSNTSGPLTKGLDSGHTIVLLDSRLVITVEGGDLVFWVGGRLVVILLVVVVVSRREGSFVHGERTEVVFDR